MEKVHGHNIEPAVYSEGMEDDYGTEIEPPYRSHIEIVLEYLDDLEDAAIAKERLSELRAGRSTTVSLEDLMKQYGMLD
jgi:hypothetical protein